MVKKRKTFFHRVKLPDQISGKAVLIAIVIVFICFVPVTPLYGAERSIGYVFLSDVFGYFNSLYCNTYGCINQGCIFANGCGPVQTSSSLTQGSSWGPSSASLTTAIPTSSSPPLPPPMTTATTYVTTTSCNGVGLCTYSGTFTQGTISSCTPTQPPNCNPPQTAYYLVFSNGSSAFIYWQAGSPPSSLINGQKITISGSPGTPPTSSNFSQSPPPSFSIINAVFVSSP